MVLEVFEIVDRAVGVRSYLLRALDGRSLPPFLPGAHVEVLVSGMWGQTRCYSLVSDPDDLSHYEIAVLRVEAGGGGSRALHSELQRGNLIQVAEPVNGFQLHPRASHSVLIAGGIGITPILSFARELARQGRSFVLYYASRSAAHMAFAEEAVALAPASVTLYFDDTGPRLELQRVMENSGDGTHVYVCGPCGLIEAVRRTAVEYGVGPAQVHFESFGYRASGMDRNVEVVLRHSGITLTAKPGRSLLDAISATGIWAPAECRRGECGTCITAVAEGTPDHRDFCLTPAQRAGSMCTCVSWASSDRLVLEL